jgi:hypothetical protein
MEYLQLIERTIEKIRTVAVRSMKSPQKFKLYLQQSIDIHQQSHLLDRLSLELADQRNLLEYEMKGLEALTSSFPGQADVNLKDNALQSIDWTKDFLTRQLSYVRNAFSEFVALRNTSVNYSLQRYVLWLSVIATVASVIGTVAAIISVIVSWTAVKQFLNEVMGITF